MKWLLVVGLSMVSSLASAADILVFTDSNTAINTQSAEAYGHKVKIHYIDAVDVGSNILNKGVQQIIRQQGGIHPGASPKDVEHVYRAAGQKFMGSKDMDGAIEKYKAGATAIQEAVRLGVRKIPAIVFDRQEVVYGVTDVSKALLYQQRGQ